MFASDYRCLCYNRDTHLWEFERKFEDGSPDYEKISVRRAKLIDKSKGLRTIYESNGSSKISSIACG
jgi:hypothetical protein